jgi:hypothetical protein
MQRYAQTQLDPRLKEWLQRGAVAAALAAVMLTFPLQVSAVNVRVEDVDNPSMQAGADNLRDSILYLGCAIPTAGFTATVDSSVPLWLAMVLGRR